MFRKEFVDVISETGMVPVRDLRKISTDNDPNVVSELGLIKLSFFDDVKFAQQVAKEYDLKFSELLKVTIPDSRLALISKSNAVKFRSIPVQKSGKAVTVAIYDPTIATKKEEISRIFQHPVEFVVVPIGAWSKLFSRIKETVEELMSTVKEIVAESVDKDQPEVTEDDIGEEVINFVNKIMVEAYVRGASDIHIEPYENDFRIRFRIDGSLVAVAKPPYKLMLPLISRVKIMAQMNISEKRKPQDGRIKLSISNSPIDYRVSSLPTLYGEKIVIRILDSESLELDMQKLGFEKGQLEVFKEGIYRPYGMCLVTGPTGSGKTTTLYSALSDLNRANVNISTCEDPVEFNINGINQVNVRKDIGFTFAASLKAFLRQDPDIIMVGEIRDLETGEIAVEAALTGHLVLSTLHTNDAPSTITRLLNMGIEPFLVVASLNIVVAQRLCRRICIECKEEVTDITIEQLIAAGISRASAEKVKIYRGKGCKFCNSTGYKGRIAIYEVMRNSPHIRDMVLRNASTDEIKKQAIKEGMKTLRMAGLTKMAQGLTTLEEVLANSASDKL